jgi:hypothetical protein
LINGDIVKISTVAGTKYARKTTAGSETSALYAVSPQSYWLKLQPGANTIRVYATGAAIPYTLTYFNQVRRACNGALHARPLLRRDEIVDQFESLIWTERFNKPGDFELVIRSTPDTRRIFKPGLLLACNQVASRDDRRVRREQCGRRRQEDA